MEWAFADIVVLVLVYVGTLVIYAAVSTFMRWLSRSKR